MKNKFSYKVFVREIRTGEKTEVWIADRIYLDDLPLSGGYHGGEAPAIEAAGEKVRDELILLSHGRECFEHCANDFVYSVFPTLGLGDPDMQDFIHALEAAGIDIVITTESRKAPVT